MSRYTTMKKYVEQETQQYDDEDLDSDQEQMVSIILEQVPQAKRKAAIWALEKAGNIDDAILLLENNMKDKKKPKPTNNNTANNNPSKNESSKKPAEPKATQIIEQPLPEMVQKPSRKLSSQGGQFSLRTRKQSYQVEEVDTQHYNKEYPKVNDEPHPRSETVSIVVIGHVDSGKSTLVGQIMHQLNEISKKQIHRNLKESKEMNKESFQFAWVTDETQEERQKGVTIDVGVKNVKIGDRTITFLDSPGHKQYIPNMISGAVQADYAVLVVDVSRFQSSFKFGGQTKEHAYIVRALGVGSIIVAINKMDLVEWKEEVFDSIRNELLSYLLEIGFAENRISFVPISAFLNVNLITTKPLPYYNGPPLVQVINSLEVPPRPSDKPFRLNIANVYESMSGKLKGHIVSGKIEGGVIHREDKLIVLPLNCQCLVKDIVHLGEKVKSATVGDNVDVQLKLIDETFFENIKPGNVLSSLQYSIPVANHFIAEILAFELQYPLLCGTGIVVFIGGTKCTGRINRILKIFDSKNKSRTIKENAKAINSNNCCEIEVTTNQKVCMELFSNFKAFGRIIMREKYSTLAVGIIKSILPSK